MEKSRPLRIIGDSPRVRGQSPIIQPPFKERHPFLTLLSVPLAAALGWTLGEIFQPSAGFVFWVCIGLPLTLLLLLWAGRIIRIVFL